MTEEEWLAWGDFRADQDGPPDPGEEDPDSAAPWDYDLDAIIAECRQVTAEEAAAAARAARLGLPGGQPVPLARRGPGQPGSARRSPGEYPSRAAGFAAGMLLDMMPGCGALAGFAAEAAGDDDRFDGAGDDEVAGVISAWDRVESYAAARKHAAVAEFIRRRPEHPDGTFTWTTPSGRTYTTEPTRYPSEDGHHGRPAPEGQLDAGWSPALPDDKILWQSMVAV